MKLHERKTLEYAQKLEAAKVEKARQWQSIKTNAPDLADFLIQLNGAFGKVKLTNLVIHNA